MEYTVHIIFNCRKWRKIIKINMNLLKITKQGGWGHMRNLQNCNCGKKMFKKYTKL